VFLNQQFSKLGTGNLARYGYATKLAVMISFAPTALATVAFPALSEANAIRASANFKLLATRSIRMTLLLACGQAALLFPIRESVVGLAFGRGAMNPGAIHETSMLFGLVLLQAVPGSLIYFLYKVSFSCGDNISPALAPCLIAISLYFSLTAASTWAGATGILIAAAIAQWTGTIGLLAYQMRRFQMISLRELLRFCSLLVPLCAAVFISSELVDYVFTSRLRVQVGMGSFFANLLEVGTAGIGGIVLAYCCAGPLGLDEARDVMRLISTRLNKIFVRERLTPALGPE
jgi:putative peptidoglycan lipid II flippase